MAMIIASLSQMRMQTSQQKAAHDHGLRRKKCMTMTTSPSTGLSIYCQSCTAWVGWAKVNQKAQPNFMEMYNDGRCSHYNPDQHPFHFPEEEASFSEGGCV